MINWFNTYAPLSRMPEADETINPYWLGPTNDGRLSMRIADKTLYMTKTGVLGLIEALNTMVKQLPEDEEFEDETH